MTIESDNMVSTVSNDKKSISFFADLSKGTSINKLQKFVVCILQLFLPHQGSLFIASICTCIVSMLTKNFLGIGCIWIIICSCLLLLQVSAYTIFENTWKAFHYKTSSIFITKQRKRSTWIKSLVDIAYFTIMFGTTFSIWSVPLMIYASLSTLGILLFRSGKNSIALIKLTLTP
jgi:hypothetical protein